MCEGGTLFLIRYAEGAMVCLTDRSVLPGLIFYDMHAVLTDLDRAAERGGAPGGGRGTMKQRRAIGRLGGYAEEVAAAVRRRNEKRKPRVRVRVGHGEAACARGRVAGSRPAAVPLPGDPRPGTEHDSWLTKRQSSCSSPGSASGCSHVRCHAAATSPSCMRNDARASPSPSTTARWSRPKPAWSWRRRPRHRRRRDLLRPRGRARRA